MDAMDNKKSAMKFTIQFSRDNPLHIQAAAILNRQTQRGKAKYIAEALVHFESCDAVPDTSPTLRFDERHIEAVVRRMLRDEYARYDGGTSTHIAMPVTSVDGSSPAGAVAFVPASKLEDEAQADDTDAGIPQSQTFSADDIHLSDAVEALGEDGLNAIARALDMFRRK